MGRQPQAAQHTIERAIGHVGEQFNETNDGRTIEVAIYINNRLIRVLLVRVDDVEGMTKKEIAELRLVYLSKAISDCDAGCCKFRSKNGKANLVDLVVRKQRRVARGLCSAELNGLVDGMEYILSLRVVLHQFDCAIAGSPPGVDANAVYDATEATAMCDPAGSSLKLHLVSVRDRMARASIRYLYWVDTRDMLADGLTKARYRQSIIRAYLAAVGVHVR